MKAVELELHLSAPGAVPVRPLVFGHFVECGFGRQTPGMWAEKVYNRAFQPITPYKDVTWNWMGLDADRYDADAPFWHSGYEENDWEPIAPSAEVEWTEGTETYKGLGSRWVWNDVEGRKQGLRQRGIHLRAGGTSDFSVFCGSFHGLERRTAPIPAGVASSADVVYESHRMTVRFLSEADPEQVLASFDFDVVPVQKRFDAVLDLPGYEGRVVIEIAFEFQGALVLSWCSLMPRDSLRGWRRDVVDLLRQARVPLIRYPGGCYASFFDWRDWVAPRERRKVLQSHFWGGLDENDAGVDEFLDLCAELGCEPQVCVDMMSSEPYEAAALVEYCNGADDTPMGRIRAGNGVERRNRVKYWEMDNEAVRKWSPLQYAEETVRFVRAMRAADPSIFAMMEFYSFGLENLAPMLAVAGKDIQAAIHRSIAPDFHRQAQAVLDGYNRANGTSIVLANTEWLPEVRWHEPFDDPEIPHDYSMGGYGRGNRAKTLNNRQIRWFYALNAASTLMDLMRPDSPIGLANFNNCVNTWGQNIVESSKEKAWLSPAGRVFALLGTAAGLLPCGSSESPEGRDAAGGALVRAQAVAEPGTGNRLVYALNKSSQEARLSLTGIPATTGVLRRLSADAPLARVEDIREEEREIPLAGTLALPPYSLTMLRTGAGGR